MSQEQQIEELTARCDALEAFAEALVAHGVGGPELQKALRDIDRAKVRQQRPAGQASRRAPPPDHSPLPTHREKLVGGGEVSFRGRSIVDSVFGPEEVQHNGQMHRVLVVTMDDGAQHQIIDEPRWMTEGYHSFASERLKPYLAS